MITIRTSTIKDQAAWDEYVYSHPSSTLYQTFGWKNVIKKTYGHKTYYLIATKNIQHPKNRSQKSGVRSRERSFSYEPSAISYACPMKREAYFTGEPSIVGILPLVHLKHLLFGNSLISIPFFDLGGILADNDKTEEALLSEAIQLGQRLKAHNIELRHIQPLSCLRELNPPNSINSTNPSNPMNPMNPSNPSTVNKDAHST